MHQNRKDADLQRLERTLSNWKVVVSEGLDGRLTAYSTCEPLFCVVRDDIEAVKAVTANVIDSYVTTFYGRSEGGVIFSEEEIQENALPIERVIPIKKLYVRPRESGSADELLHALG